MKRFHLLWIACAIAICAHLPALAGDVSRGSEFFLFDDRPGNTGRTDFFTGGADGWDTDSRIDYLAHYADFLKRLYGGLRLDEMATPEDAVQTAVAALKPQPAPLVRRSARLDSWRWALSDSGESHGWAAADFNDSKWQLTKALPLTVKGSETRDLWLRTTVKTGSYEKAFLDFESVLGDAQIYVNGAKVVGPDAFHNNSAPFRVDLTTWLSPNADNIIAVHVRDVKERGESASKDEPSKYMGWGVPGRATLVQTGPVVIDNVFVSTDDLAADNARLRVQFTLKNFTTSEFKGTARVAVRKWFPEESAAPAARAEYPVAVLQGTGKDSPAYLALDFGTADSPVQPGFVRVTPDTLYDDARGYGWDKNAGLSAVDSAQVPLVEFIDSDLKRDAIEGDRPAAFRIKTTPGRWVFALHMGSPDHETVSVVKYIDDELVSFEKRPLRPWEFNTTRVTQFVRGSAATLKIQPPKKGDVFTLNGLTVLSSVPFIQRFEKALDLPAPEPWEPGAPNLYELRLTISDESGAALDDVAVTFGVVTLEDRDGDLFVNGRRFRLRGVLETHSFPPERDDDLTCIAPPAEWIVRDILDNRGINSNVMRFHPAEALGTNYLPWLEAADQLGMFVFWAPRVWLHWGAHGPDSFRPLLAANLEPSMIAARNHPSIFAWEGGNETYFNDGQWDERAALFSDEFYDAANALDPSRFILPVSFWYAQFEGKPDFYRIDPNRGNEVPYPGAGRSPRAFWARNTFWDVHPYAGWYGMWSEIWWNAGSGHFYDKDKVFMVSEFGAEGMPNWELYRDETYYHVWNGTSKPDQWEKQRLGRNLDFSEWQISQAYQALAMHNNIAVFRTENADGMSICTGAEGRHNGAYFKGIRDMHRRPKLAYYVTGDAYRDVFVSGLNGDIVLSSGDALRPVIVNEGPARTVSLTVNFRDMSGALVNTQTIPNLALPKAANLRLDTAIKPAGLESGKYYQAEYVVADYDILQ